MRNSLGILETPQIDIASFVGQSDVYEGTEIEKLVKIAIKAVKSHKLLCLDLIDTTNHNELFGIVNLSTMRNGVVISFVFGDVNADSQYASSIQYVFFINLEDKEIGIDYYEA